MPKKEYDIELVKTKGIKANTYPLNDSVNVRTSLRVPIRRNVASLILMNPSKADSKESDNTINFVTEYIHKNLPDVQWIRFFNLFPFYEPNSSNIYTLINGLSSLEYQNTMESNRSEIKKSLNSTTYLFLGYGQCSGGTADKAIYSSETHELLKMIETYYKKEIYVFETSQSSEILIKNKYPRHPNPNNKHVAIKHHLCQVKNGEIKL